MMNVIRLVDLFSFYADDGELRLCGAAACCILLPGDTCWP